MTLEIGILFALLGVMIYLFLTEKLPVDPWRRRRRS
jgi:hypothetical protein